MSHRKRKIASKKQNLEHKCILQESCKTVRRWQRSILLVKGGHCVGDCAERGTILSFRSLNFVPPDKPQLYSTDVNFG